MKKTSMLLLVLCISFSAYTQKVVKQNLKFNYIKLPNTPLDKAIKNSNGHIVLVYEDAIGQTKQNAQDEYEKAKAEYPQKVAEAEEEHAAKMEKYKEAKAEWDKKSGATKFFEKNVLEENNKPVEPVYRKPSEPVLKTVKTLKLFDKKLLANTYLKLEGFGTATDNAVKVTATLYGFESLEPELKQKEESYYDTKSQSTQKKTTYWYEVQYKHPIGIKVELPSGEVVMDEIPQQFAEYKVATTSNQNFNKQAFLEQLENKVVEANMKEVNETLNSKYGYVKINRESVIYRIESKSFTYNDFQEAYENAVTGYDLLVSNYTSAAQKLGAACELWEKALTEYVVGAKKVRIDQEVAMAARFNLAEAYLFTNNFDKADAHLSKIIGMDPSNKEKKLVAELRDLMKDLRTRWEANNN